MISRKAQITTAATVSLVAAAAGITAVSMSRPHYQKIETDGGGMAIEPYTLPPRVELPAAELSVIGSIRDAEAACARWRAGTAMTDVSEENAARAIAVCNALIPPVDRVAVSIPGSGIAVSLDERSVAVGAGLGVFGLLALRGLAAMFRGPDRRAPQRAPDPIPHFRYDDAQ